MLVYLRCYGTGAFFSFLGVPSTCTVTLQIDKHQILSADWLDCFLFLLIVAHLTQKLTLLVSLSTSVVAHFRCVAFVVVLWLLQLSSLLHCHFLLMCLCVTSWSPCVWFVFFQHFRWISQRIIHGSWSDMFNGVIFMSACNSVQIQIKIKWI